MKHFRLEFEVDSDGVGWVDVEATDSDGSTFDTHTPVQNFSQLSDALDVASTWVVRTTNADTD